MSTDMTPEITERACVLVIQTSNRVALEAVTHVDKVIIFEHA